MNKKIRKLTTKLEYCELKLQLADTSFERMSYRKHIAILKAQILLEERNGVPDQTH